MVCVSLRVRNVCLMALCFEGVRRFSWQPLCFFGLAEHLVFQQQAFCTFSLCYVQVYNAQYT